MSDRRPSPLRPAALDWAEGGPRSRDFGDVYFSAEDGMAESRHVFLAGIGAPDVWAGRDRFAIGELGFGTGLNFLQTWEQWRRTAPARARLHYVAVEGYPLGADDLKAAQAMFPGLAPLAAELQAVYPEPVPGFHRRRLDGGRIALTLLYGPVADMLEQLSGRVDAWYLDGFAPSRNPDMWTPAVLRLIVARARPGAAVATFSAAGAVRRGLQGAGFDVAKRPGFGAKRECLHGRLAAPPDRPAPVPWFSPPEPLPAGAAVSVIGGGIAGMAAAAALADEGFRVTVADPALAGEAAVTAPPAALVSPRLADPGAVYGRFMAAAFLMGEHRLAALGLETTGCLWLAGDERALHRAQGFAEALGWTDNLAVPVDGGTAADIAGLPLGRLGLLFPTSRLVHPADVLAALGRDEVECRPARLDRLRLEDGAATVLANGPWAKALAPAAELPLYANRGQLNFLPAIPESRALRVPLSYGGHVTPALAMGGAGARHVVGSSYGQWDDLGVGGWEVLHDQDRAESLDRLAALLPDLAAAWRAAPPAGWAGLRATTEDHLPVVGPLADAAAYRRDYAELHHGRRPETYPSAAYLPNAFVLSGLGSRGYQTAFLAAELLAAQLAGMPLPVPADQAAALHPARGIVRALRRRPT